jgi:hypothetical protein
MVATAEHRALVSASIGGVGDNADSFQAIRISDAGHGNLLCPVRSGTLVMTGHIVVEKMAL